MAQVANPYPQVFLAMSSDAERGDAPPAPRRGAILVVEDRDDVRQGLVQLLELHGFLVGDAASADDALKQLRTDPDAYALLLLDLLLPGTMDGHELRTQQLADPQLAEVPAIVMTTSELDSRERARLQPAACLEKPFRFDDLLAIVKRHVTPAI